MKWLMLALSGWASVEGPEVNPKNVWIEVGRGFEVGDGRPVFAPEFVEQVARRLAYRIPPPARPRPVPQASWQGLKAGQWLRSRMPIIGSKQYPAGTPFTAFNPTNLGVELWENHHLALPTEGVQCALTWSLPEWRKWFEVVRRPGVRKGKG